MAKVLGNFSRCLFCHKALFFNVQEKEITGVLQLMQLFILYIILYNYLYACNQIKIFKVQQSSVYLIAIKWFENVILIIRFFPQFSKVNAVNLYPNSGVSHGYLLFCLKCE